MKSNLEDLREVIRWNYCDEFTVALDYLRIVFYDRVPYLDKMLRLLYTKDWNLIDNSNYIIKNDVFTWASEFSSTGKAIKCSYSYNWVSVPIMFYEVFYKNSASHNAYSRLDLYWWFWRLLDLWEFELNFFDDFLKSLLYVWDIYVTRVDYRVDMFRKKWVLLFTDIDCFPNLDTRTSIVKRWNRCSIDWWNWEVWSKYIGRYFVRCYNKLKDVMVKWKQFLYWDYLWYDNVIRLEVQFNRKYCNDVRYNIWDLYKSLTWCSASDSWDFLSFYNHIRWLFWLSNYSKHTWYNPRSWYVINDYNRVRLTSLLLSTFSKFTLSWVNPLIIMDQFVSSSVDDNLKYNYEQQLQEFLEYRQNKDNVKVKRLLKSSNLLKDWW